MEPSAHSASLATVKMMIAWVGLVVGGITLSQIVLVLTGVFSALQIYKLVHDLRRQNRMDRVAEQAAASAIATVQALKEEARP